MAQKTGDLLVSDMETFEDWQWTGFNNNILEKLSNKSGEEIAKQVQDMTKKWTEIIAVHSKNNSGANVTKKRKF